MTMNTAEQTSSFSFSVEHATTVPDKGVLVTGVCEGTAAGVGDRVRYVSPDGVEREALVVAVVARVADNDGKVLEGRTGLVLDELERKNLRPPLVLTGFSETGKPGETPVPPNS